MKKLFILLVTIILLYSCNTKDGNLVIATENEFRKEIKIHCEKAYFEGQRDALNNDIRIKLSKDSIYIWIKSPWNDDTKPEFIPSYLDTKNN